MKGAWEGYKNDINFANLNAVPHRNAQRRLESSGPPPSLALSLPPSLSFSLSHSVRLVIPRMRFISFYFYIEEVLEGKILDTTLQEFLQSRVGRY